MYTQAELLEKRSCSELLDLLFRLGVDPETLPSARRREPMVLAALEALRFSPDTPLYMLGWDAVKALAGIVSRRDGDTVSTALEQENETLSWGLWTLRSLGLAWRDRSGWHLLPQVHGLIARGKRKREELRAADRLLDECERVLTLYGAAPVTVAGRAMLLLAGERMPQADFDGWADFLFALMVQRHGFGCTVNPDGDTGEPWLCSELCREPEALLQQLREKAGQDWFTPAKRSLAWLPGMIPVEEACGDALLRALVEDLSARGDMPDRTRLEDTFVDAFLYVQEDDPQTAESTLLALFPDTAADKRRLLVRQAVNTMPRWADKGFSRQALIHRAAARIRPVKGTSPCPCGSGKQYKYCHGRLC